MVIISSKRRRFSGKNYIVDEAESNKFDDVVDTLRNVADNLESEKFSEESRIEAIKSIMPLIGRMRAGIAINEEEEITDENSLSDEVIKKAYDILINSGFDFVSEEKFSEVIDKNPDVVPYIEKLATKKGNAEKLMDSISKILCNFDEEEDDDMVSLSEESDEGCSKKKIIKRKVIK